MTQKEAVYALLKGEKPDVIINGWEPFQIIYDAVILACNPSPGEDHTYVDCWGVTFVNDPEQPGGMPSEDPALLACDDITEWKEQLTIPDPRSWELDFGGTFAQLQGARANDKIALAFLPCGVFEESHHVLGFEEALVDYLIEPDDMHEFIDALFDWKLECVKLQMENWEPDGFLLHDDWGSKDSLLLPPDVWREFFKEGYKKICDYIHERGKFVMIHSDSNNELIAADMEEIGVDIWQGALPTADIAGLQERLPGKMIFMGGYESSIIDRIDTKQEEIVAEVKRAIAEYLPGGKYIPSITYGSMESIYPGVDDVIIATINELNNQ